MDPILDPTVFVIESPSPVDIRDERSEGSALSAALHLAEMTSEPTRIILPFHSRLIQAPSPSETER
jgi:hypothetical protein